jgi:hypothetical protein
MKDTRLNRMKCLVDMFSQHRVLGYKVGPYLLVAYKEQLHYTRAMDCVGMVFIIAEYGRIGVRFINKFRKDVIFL